MSAHKQNKTAVVAFEVFKLRQQDAETTFNLPVLLAVSPLYRAVLMYKELGYILVNGASVILIIHDSVEGVLDKI